MFKQIHRTWPSLLALMVSFGLFIFLVWIWFPSTYSFKNQNTSPFSNLSPPSYRTFIILESYEIENNGEENPISYVQLQLNAPHSTSSIKAILPSEDQYWPIQNGQVQTIEQVWEVSPSLIHDHSFTFSIQIIRKGDKYKPCLFQVKELDQYNRTYICKTDLAWQRQQGISEEKLDREGLRLKVITDKNTPKKELEKILNHLSSQTPL